MPLRSAPAEAAVAEVLGTLPVVVAVIFTCARSIWNSSATTWATLMIQALAHLGPAVVQVHAAVRVDMHQRAGLIEGRGGERDAEFHRRQREAALKTSARCVEAVMASRRAAYPALSSSAVDDSAEMVPTSMP